MTDTARRTQILPFSPENYPERIPDFQSEEEVREFWDTHDSSYYWDQMEDVTDNPPPGLAEGPGPEKSTARKRPNGDRMELVSVYVPTEVIEGIKAIAEARNTSYPALLRSWIGERLAHERSVSSTTDSMPA